MRTLKTVSLRDDLDGPDDAEASIESEAPEVSLGSPRKARSKPKPAPAAKKATDLDGYDLTEDGIALAFTAAHQDRLRYDHTRGAWFEWTGKVWQRDETRRAFSWARVICRRLAENTNPEKPLATLAKAATAAAVERFAQSDPNLAVTSAVWDTDPWLLGTPEGVVDLKTGKLRPASPDDHITKLTAVGPAERAECPLWLAFLDQAAAGDAALVGFLRRWFGYTLTGVTVEHALLFVFGDGGNGKGVCMGTIHGIMGAYAANAAMDTFAASKGDKHPTDMAMLAGARMVMTTEVDEGQVWAEARLKSLTGGDPVTARFMRRDFFTYIPNFKLTISGNHKPQLRNVDPAARRRFNLAPFIHKPASPDKMLSEKLKAEWPGILRWMIDGCLEWQRHGLMQPDAVKLATEEYFDEQDSVQQWIAENCVKGATQSDTTTTLFKSWTTYATASGEKPGTSKWFAQTLARQGFESVKNTPGEHGKRGFKGISVKREAPRPYCEPPEG